MEKEVIIGNDLSEIAHVVNFMKDLGNSLQLPSDTIMGISLALEEAVANVIKHAFPDGGEHEIRLKVNVFSGEICFLLIDKGIPFNPISAEETWDALKNESNSLGKLGLSMIRHMMDEVSYVYKENLNMLTMKKKLDIELKAEKTMHLNFCKIEGVTILTIEGRLDTVNSREFDSSVQPFMLEESPNLIINCENFVYISSSGIRSLILLQKSVIKKKGRLVLEGMKPEMRKIFDMTGCSSLFTIR